MGIAHLKTSVGSGSEQSPRRHRGRQPEHAPRRSQGRSTSTARSANGRWTTARLVEFIQNFADIPLGNDDFEFPDLLGAAYEYLIKYFADSAGKKGGEFYTPAEVVRLMVQIDRAAGRHGDLRPDLRLGRHVDPVEAVRQEIGGDPATWNWPGRNSTAALGPSAR